MKILILTEIYGYELTQFDIYNKVWGKLSVTIDKHDFDTRVRNSSKYLEKGHKIKVSIRFKGREMAHPELGREVLLRFAKEVEDIAIIDQQPKMEGRFMTMMLIPNKDK